MFKSEPHSHIVCRCVVPRSVQICVIIIVAECQSAGNSAAGMEDEMPGISTV